MNDVNVMPEKKSIGFHWIPEAFGIYRRDLRVWIPSAAILALLLIALNVVTNGMIVLISVANTGTPTQPDPSGGVSVILCYAIGLASSFVYAYLWTGFLRISNAAVQGRPISIGMLFRGGDTTGEVWLTGIVLGVLSSVGLVAVIVGGFVVLGVLGPALAMAADGGGAVEAIKRSFHAMKPHWLMASLLFGLLVVATGLSVLPLLLGFLVVGPIYALCLSIAYRDMLGLVSEAAPVLPSRTPLASMRKELGILCLLIVVCILTYGKNHNFLSSVNIQDLATLVGIFGIFSIGAAIAIITGGIDLTVGSIFALEGVLLALALNSWHWNQYAAVFAALAFTICLGLVHGLLITKIPLQPFIVTLCGLMIYRGLAEGISGENTEGFGGETGYGNLINITTGSVSFGGPYHLGNWTLQPPAVPNTFVFLIFVATVIWVLVHRSVWGRYLFAVGRNEEAARYSGINSQRIIISAYVIAGLLTGIAGILFAFYTFSISPSNHGQGYELYGIAAAVLGGCSLRGGEGSVIGVLIGTTLLQVLQNLVNLLGIPSALNLAVVGTVILIGVITDEIFKRYASKKARQA